MARAERSRALAAELARHRRLAQAGAALSVLAALVWPAQAAVIAAAIAALTGEGGLAPVPAALILIALAALRAGADAASLALGQRLAARVRQALRERLIAVALARTPAGAAEDSAGLASLMGEGIARIGPFVERYRPARLRAAIMAPVILGLALWQSWAAALALALTGPLIPVFMALIGWAAEAASRRHLVEQGALNRLLLDHVAALADLRLLGATDRAAHRLAVQAEDLRTRTMAVLRLAFLSSAVLEFFAALGVALVAVHVGLSLLGLIGWGSWGGLSVFGGIFVLLIAPDFYQPLRDLAAIWHDRADAEAAAKAVDAALSGGVPILGRGGWAAPPTGTLAWTGLRIARGDRVIAPPDGSLGPGAALAVTGPSGAGKTSLLCALAGLIPCEGSVTWRALRLGPATADAFRAGMALIPQIPRFSDTPLGDWLNPDGAHPPEAVAAALRAARVDAVVAALPEGLGTRLGETGGGISGGEARRLMIARALLARPAVLLADEPTADLDPASARAVTEALLALSEGGTVLLVVTHDATLAARMDRRLILETPA